MHAGTGLERRLQVSRTRSSRSGGDGELAGAPAPVRRLAESGGGRSLPAPVRAFMHAHFRYDFGHVRIHDDARAAEAARSVGALAYALGSDIVFGRGAFRPQTPAGLHLVAHELAHVIQQDREPSSSRQRYVVGPVDDPLERAAGRAASAVVRGEQSSAPSSSHAVVRTPVRAAGPVLRRAKAKTESREADWAAGFEEAVKAGEWLTAAMTLWLLDNAEIRRILDPLSDADLGALEAALAAADMIKLVSPGFAAKFHRHMSFQKNAPKQPGKRKMATTWPEGERGTLRHKGGVGEEGKEGTVKVRTGTEFHDPTHVWKDGFSLKFKGKQASETSWLQFVWREMEVWTNSPQSQPLARNWPRGSGGTYPLTTDPQNKNYYVDSNDPANPFYEAKGNINNRTGEATTIFDAPSSGDPIAWNQFASGATMVVSRAHFTSYLVREMDVLYTVTIDLEWVYLNPNVPPRPQPPVVHGGEASALDPAMRNCLVQQYPAIDYLP